MIRMKTPGLLFVFVFCFVTARGQNEALTLPPVPPLSVWEVTQTLPASPGVSPIVNMNLTRPEVVNPGLYDPVLLTPVAPVRLYPDFNTQNVRLYPDFVPSQPNRLQDRGSCQPNGLQNHSSGKVSYSSNMFASPYKKQ